MPNKEVNNECNGKPLLPETISLMQMEYCCLMIIYTERPISEV